MPGLIKGKVANPCFELSQTEMKEVLTSLFPFALMHILKLNREIKNDFFVLNRVLVDMNC